MEASVFLMGRHIVQQTICPSGVGGGARNPSYSSLIVSIHLHLSLSFWGQLREREREGDIPRRGRVSLDYVFTL